MSKRISQPGRTGAVISRIVAAVLGGYVVAALSSVAVLWLPVDRSQAVIAGMLTSFLVYAGAVVWVFTARSATRAWVGLGVAGTPPALAAWRVWSVGPL